MKPTLSVSLACLACAVLQAVPLRFEPAGDSSPGRFIVRGLRSRFSFTRDHVEFSAPHRAWSLRFDGAAPGARIDGVEKLRSTTNIFRGKDAAKWRTAVPNYGRLQVRGLYPGVDAVYYGNAGELEYDLIVKPRADPA